MVTTERLVALSRTATFLSVLARSYLRQGEQAKAARIEQKIEERALRGEYVPAIARLMMAMGHHDFTPIRQAMRACYQDRTSWFTVALALGPVLDTLLEDPEIGPLVRAMREGREAPALAGDT